MTVHNPTPLWRLAFKADGQIVANGNVSVGRVTHILETGMYIGVMMWDGEWFEARAKTKQTLLALLKEKLSLPGGIIGNVDDSLRLH